MTCLIIHKIENILVKRVITIMSILTFLIKKKDEIGNRSIV